MKYIMYKSEKLDKYFPILFPDAMVHVMVHKALAESPAMQEIADDIVPVSAGEYDVVSSSCYGRSETMKMNSREVDRRIILMYAMFHGIASMYE